jgi:glyoxylase-like metal-dependent hydrolase (beta-lactamase superfamily II)
MSGDRAEPFDCIAFEGETNGYLIVRGAESLLIDCPFADMAARIRAAGLPLPRTILHTQVQEEHCREWASLPRAEVFVAEECLDVARRAPAFFREVETRWPPSREWDPATRGMDKYGIAGAMTERPPREPLAVAGALVPGHTFRWHDVELEVLALPGCGKRAIGLFWRRAGILFSGDLMRAGGYLVNFYDCERGYGIQTGYRELARSLQSALDLNPRRALPTTGPAIEAPAADATRLLARLEAVLNPLQLGADRPPPPPGRREFGLFREHAGGLVQCKNYGNMIVYIDRAGRGLCVDPDICVWHDWATNCRLMHEAFDTLEKEAGLRRMEWGLITHPHGDHMQYGGLLRERYGTTILATADVADVLERPRDFPYPCLLHWYGFPFESFVVDRRLRYEEPVRWRDVPVTPIHTPGHCFAHAGFVIPWNGLRTMCTGDTLQYTTGAIAQPLPVIYSDAAWPVRGFVGTYERVLRERPDLVLGGHSAYFQAADGAVLRDWIEAARDSEARARALVHGRALERAMTPPGFDAVRPVCPELSVPAAGLSA